MTGKPVPQGQPNKITRPSTANDPPDTEFARALAQHKAGNPAVAQATCHAVLACHPNHAGALHLLGVLDLKQNRVESAIAYIERALRVNPQVPVYHLNLGLCHVRRERLTEALAAYAQCLLLDPSRVDAHFNAAVIQARLGNIAEAEKSYRRVLALQPDHLGALNNLGELLLRLDQAHKALTPLRRAVAANADIPQSRLNLALALTKATAYHEALVHFDAVIAMRPDWTEGHSQHAKVLASLGRHEEAISILDKAIAAQPPSADYRNDKGVVLAEMGRNDEAAEEFKAALQLDSDHARALFNLSTSNNPGNPAPLLTRIEARLTQALPDDEQRLHLHFAAGAFYEKQGDIGRAFAHYERGNRLRRPDFSASETAGRFARLRRVFNAAFFAGRAGFGAMSNLPVFILGMPRSGTSLVEQIIASHPRAHGAGELRSLNLISAGLQRYLRLAVPYPDCMPKVDRASAQRLGEDYLAELGRLGSGAARVTDKMPGNFENLGLIASLLPQARVIHCVRDPVETCFSCFTTNFSADQPFAWDLRHLGEYYNEYRRLMAHWKAVLPLPILDVSYETLVEQPEPTIRALIDFCGLEWDDRCLQPHLTQRTVRTASMAQVRRPIYTTSKRRSGRFAEFLAPLREALNRERTDASER